MSEDLMVNPTVVQRNKFDVATELTKLYYTEYDIEDVEEMQTLFAKFYAIAQFLESRKESELQALVPEEMIRSISRHFPK